LKRKKKEMIELIFKIKFLNKPPSFSGEISSPLSVAFSSVVMICVGLMNEKKGNEV